LAPKTDVRELSPSKPGTVGALRQAQDTLGQAQGTLRQRHDPTGYPQICRN
jgi:hypothetical protein